MTKPAFGDDAIICGDAGDTFRCGHSPPRPRSEHMKSRCRTGCPTQDHRSWGECARAANVRIAYCGIGGGDASAQKRWDDELDLYRQARAQGIQPDSTKLNDVTEAIRLSDESGARYGVDFNKADPVEA